MARCFFSQIFICLEWGGDFQSYLGPDLYPPKRPAMYGYYYQFLFPQAMKKNMAQSWGPLEKRQTACSKEKGGSWWVICWNSSEPELKKSHSIKFRFICMFRHRVERIHLQMIAKRPCDGTDLSKQTLPSCLFFLW